MKIEVITGPSTGSQFEFEKGEVTIGSSAQCDLIINDIGVAPFHAELTKREKELLIIAKEGEVKLGGKRVKEGEITPGEKLEIGNITLTVSTSAGKGLNKPLLMAAGGGLAVLFMLFVFLLPTGRSPVPGEDTSKPVVSEELLASYQRKLDIGKKEFSSLSPEEIANKVRKELKVGQSELDAISVDPKNIGDAFICFMRAKNYLSRLPAGDDSLKAEVERLIFQTRTLQDKYYQNLRFMAEKEIRVEKWKEAGEHLEMIKKVVVNPEDERYRYALKQLKQVKRRR
jgi:hypothetical protein